MVPFIAKKLKEIDYEGLGESDAKEFTKDFNEILKLAAKALEQQSCEDTISRQDTMKTIIKHLGIRSEEYLLPAEKAIYKIVKNMPPATPTQRWVPVSERLPKEKINPISEDFYEYQCTVKFGDFYDVRSFKFGRGHWWHGAGLVDEYVIAWIPSPEPYKDVDEVKKT